jgi:hypothetical protein
MGSRPTGQRPMAGHALHLENTHGEVRGGPRMWAGHSGTDPPWVIRGDAFRRAGSDGGDALCLDGWFTRCAPTDVVHL